MIVMSYEEALDLKDTFKRDLEEMKKTMTPEKAKASLIRSGIFTSKGVLASKFQSK